LNSIQNKNLIIAGDVNLNLLKPNRKTESYIIKMASYGLESKITEPTRVLNDSATLIDHIFVRHGLGMDVDTDAWVVDTDVTDHRATVLCVRCQRSPGSAKRIFQLNGINFNKLNNILSKTVWNEVFRAQSVNEVFENFVTVLDTSIGKSQCPKSAKEKRLKGLKPWMTNSLLNLVIQKNSMYRALRKNPNNEIFKIG